jgi:hypothetical protein
VSDDKIMKECLIRLGRIGQLRQAIAAVLAGAQDVEQPQQLIHSAIFLHNQMATELDGLEDSIHGWTNPNPNNA